MERIKECECLAYPDNSYFLDALELRHCSLGFDSSSDTFLKF